MARVNRALHDFVCATGVACCCYFVEQIFCLIFLWKRKKIHMKYLYQIFPLAILWFGSHSRILAGEKKNICVCIILMKLFRKQMKAISKGRPKIAKFFGRQSFAPRVEIEILWRIRTCRCFKCYLEFMNLLLLEWCYLEKRRSTVETLANSFYHTILFYQFFNIKFDREYDFCWCDHKTFRRNWVFIKFFFHRCWI